MVLQGVIDRRILVNYRLNHEALSKLLPLPFRPKIHKGYGIGGICLIRLKDERPSGLPPVLGLDSENAAHRYAVEWEQAGVIQEGVFVPRRDTSSCLSTALGGRLFPGDQHYASFKVDEHDDQYEIEITSRDGKSRLTISGRAADTLPQSSIFPSVAEASAFFERGSVGYSSTPDPTRFDGIELHTHRWRVEPLEINRVESSMFDDETIFPSGTAVFDHALIMRDISHEWHSLEQLCCLPETTS